MTPDLELTGLKAIVGWIGSIVTWRQGNSARKDDRTDTALASLMKAALETKHYLAQLRDSPQMRNPNKEQELATLWSSAGIDMSHIDSDLAGRYLMKADYWSDTDGSTAENDNRLIWLDEMLRLGRQALLS